MGDWLSRYQSVWSIDFEFSCPPGERPTVVCLVAREFHSRRLIRLTKSDLQTMAVPPFAVGEQDLFVAYFSSAEWNCFASLGWPLPARVLDLWCEFKAMTNGMNPVAVTRSWDALRILVATPSVPLRRNRCGSLRCVGMTTQRLK